MGLGYEGWVKVDGKYALGTGASVPRVRPRLESAAGYGGQIKTPPSEIGIGLPYNYDYDVFDGNLSFEVSIDLLRDVLFDWVTDRQSPKEVEFSTRYNNQQKFTNSFWSSITLTGSAEAAIDGSVSFVALDRDIYSTGDFNDPDASKMGNPGDAPICSDSDFPPSLNPSSDPNQNPIPGWDVEITIGGNIIEFITWSLSFSQDVVKFFACEVNTDPTEPKYLAVGPMTVVFSGTYVDSGFFDDSLDVIEVKISPNAGSPVIMTLKRCENNQGQDDLQPPDGLTVLECEYNVYEIEYV